MEGIEALYKEGALGIMLGLSILANVYQYNRINAIQEKRIEEAKNVRDNIADKLDAIGEAMKGQTNLLQNFITFIKK